MVYWPASTHSEPFGPGLARISPADQLLTWSAARPEKSRRCSLSRSAAIDGRHVSRNVALSAKLEMNVWTRSSLKF